ncbi:MAG TPA: ankyrin repeat domain-containing protein, partial [Flavobacteriaceae bacterium]|nr:ankyrin repeat domain-containing protein [Flavobacteriaceae bacterium]
DLGTDINDKSNGMTPAMYAAKFNRVEILELLIENGANLKARSDQGWTAKKYAELSNAKEAKTVIENALTKK